jgi:hypothetical protein
MRSALTFSMFALRLESRVCQAFKTLLKFLNLAIKTWVFLKMWYWPTVGHYLQKMFLFHPIILKPENVGLGDCCTNADDTWTWSEGSIARV